VFKLCQRLQHKPFPALVAPVASHLLPSCRAPPTQPAVEQKPDRTPGETLHPYHGWPYTQVERGLACRVRVCGPVSTISSPQIHRNGKDRRTNSFDFEDDHAWSQVRTSWPLFREDFVPNISRFPFFHMT